MHAAAGGVRAAPPGGEPALRRAVSRWQIVGLSLNDVVGSGVYLLPAAAAALLGPSSLLAVIAAGFAVALLVLCFAEASSHFEEPGGAYLYARTAFGDLVGFQVGWMTWIARIASVSSLSVGFAQALGYLWPATESGLPRTLAIALPLLALTLVNVLGVRSAVGTAMVLTIGKIAPLVVFCLAGLFAARWETLAAQPAGSGRLGEAALLILFAYAGFENTPAPAGEFRNPRRDVPFALLVQVAIVTTLYVSAQWVALGTLPNAAESATPLADAAERFLGGWGGLLMTAGAVVSILGTNSNSVLAGPRYLLALARDGYGPRFLAAIHPTFRTPARAILFQAALVLPLALSGTFTALAALSVVARLTSYVGTAAAVPVLRRKLGRGAWQIPFGSVIPIAAVAMSLALAASASARSLISAGVALALGLVVFLLRDDAQPRRQPS